MPFEDPIDEADDTSSFNSGEASLDRYLIERALSNHLADISRCYVWTDSKTQQARRIGVRVLLVHALHERAATFYESLGFERSPTDPLHLFVLLTDARKSLDS